MRNLAGYRKLSIEILRTTRGKLSQRQLSIKLKNSPNIVSRWEAGARLFYFDQLIQVCSVRRIDIASLINRSFVFNEELSEASLFTFLRGKETSRAFGKALGIPKTKVERFIHGRSRVPCHIML